MMSEPLVGNCTNDPNADYWFPENENGRPSMARRRELVSSINYAIEQCNSCPAKERCLEEGMKSENLPHGIWGGLLAGERIATLGRTRENYGPQSDMGRAMDFADKMIPLVRW